MKTIDIHAHLVPRSLWQAAEAGREWHGFRHEPGDGLGANVAKDMVEIFKDIAAGDELFANFSLITESELPEYTLLVSRLDRTGLDPGLQPEDRNRLMALALRLIPARHRLGRIDEAFTGKVVAARYRFAETLPAPLARRFAPYDREQYFADGTLLENILFGKVVATSTASWISASDAPAARARLAMLATPSGWDWSASTIMVMRSLYFAGMAPSRRTRSRWAM